MSSFTKSFDKDLVVIDTGDGRKWQLAEDFEYHVGSKDSDEVIKVPAGFITDFATIPQFLWGIFPPTGRYTKAAVIHDYLTANKGRIPHATADDNTITYRCYTKKQVDKIFLEAMKVLGVNIVTRRVIWAAVSAFGNRRGYINN
jgi:hypothetical protein